MNRRGFLKGSGAMAAIPVVGRFAGGAVSAQTPMYEGEVIYTFTEFAGTAYDFQLDGTIDAASTGGVIVGSDRVDGQVVPCSWSLTGERTVLDVGTLDYAGWRNMAVSPNGQLAGTLELSPDDPLLASAITWASGTPEALPANDPASSFARAVNDAGVVAGSASQQAARWTGSGLEMLTSPPGAVGSTISLVDSAGAVFGTFLDSEFGVIGTPWKWNLDGSVESIALPDELIGSGFDKMIGGYTRVSAPFENGDYLLSARWKVGEIWTSGSWLNASGHYRAIESGGVPADLIVFEAPSPDQLIGYGPNFAPAIWTNGTLSLLADVSILPAGVSPSRVIGVVNDGRIVMTASTAEETPQIVVLRPV